MVRTVGITGMVVALAVNSGNTSAQDGRTAPSVDTVHTQSASFTVTVVATGLTTPVATAFLPDGRVLLAERTPGRVSLLDLSDGSRRPIAGLGDIWTEGDAGLLDVLVGPDWSEDAWIYVAYSAPADGGSTTVLDRARLVGNAFVDRERLFTSDAFERNQHYGGRIAFADRHVFLTVGDRETRDLAQSTGTHNGTVVRLRMDGTVPTDNPFVGVSGARPEVWSYGHRNPQGMAVSPHTGSLWVNEHGPQGGDEINVVQPGENYGWPLVTYGEEYGGGPVGEGRTRRPGTTQPVYVYRPSIAPSDLVFPTGPAFPGWSRHALIGAMGLEHLNVLTLDGDRVLHEERVLTDRGWRVRMIDEASDGTVYLGTDSGLLVRLVPLGGE